MRAHAGTEGEPVGDFEERVEMLGQEFRAIEQLAKFHEELEALALPDVQKLLDKIDIFIEVPPAGEYGEKDKGGIIIEYPPAGGSVP